MRRKKIRENEERERNGRLRREKKAETKWNNGCVEIGKKIERKEVGDTTWYPKIRNKTRIAE